MKKGTIIMLCGLPGAGKTTLAKRLEKERPAVRLCADEWLIPLLKMPIDTDEAKRLRDPMEKLLLELAQKLVGLGMNVILDNGFWTKSDREYYHNASIKYAGRVELHFLDAPFDVLWERVTRRNKEGYEFNIDAQYLKKWHGIFQPPTKEERKTYDFYKKY